MIAMVLDARRILTPALGIGRRLAGGGAEELAQLVHAPHQVHDAEAGDAAAGRRGDASQRRPLQGRWSTSRSQPGDQGRKRSATPMVVQ